MKIGDVVYLKSGGPAMVVSRIEDDDARIEVQCEWINAKGKPQFGDFD